jgi:hypothetical protein
MAEGVCLSHVGFRSFFHSPAASTLYAGFETDIWLNIQ